MAALPPDRSEELHTDSLLFGSGYGFGGTFAYAKQAAAFAAGVTCPNEALPSANFADPSRCWHTPETPSRVGQNRKHIRPLRQVALR